MDCVEQQRHSYGAAVCGAAILSETGHGASHTACRPVGRDSTCEGSFSAEVGVGAEATSAARVSGVYCVRHTCKVEGCAGCAMQRWLNGRGGHQPIMGTSSQRTVPF